MADGVAPGDVYKTLASGDGVDRAFRKLDQLRPYIVWWETSADAAKILGSGEVLMTSAANPAIVAAETRFPPGLSRRYLTEFIRFRLGEAEKQAIREFARLLYKHGVVQAGPFAEPVWV